MHSRSNNIKGVCQISWVSYHRASRGSSVIIPACLHGLQIFSGGYFVASKFFSVGPKYLPVGILWVQIFFSCVFRGFKIFSREYIVSAKFPLVGNFVIFSCYRMQKLAQKYIWNYVFYSKSVSTTVNSTYIRKVLHLLNYLCY